MDSKRTKSRSLPSRKKVRWRNRNKRHQNTSLDNVNFFTRTFAADITGDKGLWCGDCRRRQPWKALSVIYELRTGDVYRVWFCPTDGLMLREDNLTDYRLATELENQEKNMDLSGQKTRMVQLEAGVEELLGMTMQEYAALADQHPKKAKKVFKKALKKCEDLDKEKRLKKLKKEASTKV